MKREKLYELSDKFNAYLQEVGYCWADEYDYGNDYIAYEISMGDWKHDHLYFKDLAYDFFTSLGYEVNIQSVVTEDTESDCYGAAHYIYLDDPEVYKGPFILQEV